MKSTTLANGYLAPNTGNGSPILEVDRSAVAAIANLAWKHGAAQVLNFGEQLSTTSSTDKNVIDGTSTTVSTSTPGFTLDMRYKNRLSKTTVPVRMRVLASCDAATGGTASHVRLKDSTGATVLEATGFGASPTWITVDGTLPATLAKYDLFAAAAGATGVRATLDFTGSPSYNGVWEAVTPARPATTSRSTCRSAPSDGPRPVRRVPARSNT